VVFGAGGLVVVFAGAGIFVVTAGVGTGGAVVGTVAVAFGGRDRDGDGLGEGLSEADGATPTRLFGLAAGVSGAQAVRAATVRAAAIQ
jgi:hypothetical protein